MSVVNVKVAFIRPKFNDLKEWMEDPRNVYIGRKCIIFVERDGQKYRWPKEDSVWANPFKINDKSDRSDVIKKYKKYITEKLEMDENLKKQLFELKNKNLGCWCKEKTKNVSCHGDVLMELVHKYEEEKGDLEAWEDWQNEIECRKELGYQIDRGQDLSDFDEW